MWECWNNENEKVIQRSFLIKELSQEQIDKLPFICPNCKEKLCLVKEHLRLQGKSIVRAHFRHSSETQCQGYVHENESPEHYNEKMKLLDLLHNNEYSLNIDGLNFDLKINKEGIQFAKDEVNLNNRIADVLLTFRKPNSILGLGIAFEITVSEKEESIEKKIKDWTTYGYSVAHGKNSESMEVKPYFSEVKNFVKEIKEEIDFAFKKTKYYENNFMAWAAKYEIYCTSCFKAWKCKKEKHAGCLVCYHEQSKNYLIHRQHPIPCEFWEPKYVDGKLVEIKLEEPILTVKCDRVEV